MASTRRSLAAGLLATVIVATSPGASVRGQATTGSPEVLDEVVVTGERSGPGLWHVRRGAAQLWILGSLSPLPKGITWRSRQVEQVVTTANAVLVAKPLEIGFARALWIFLTHHDLLMVSGGRRLRDVLPPELYRRFATQREHYVNDADKWERYRPILAAAFLEESAFRRVGLSTRIDLGTAVRALANKHDVPIEEVRMAGVRDILDVLKTVPAATENKCMAAALSTIEIGLPRLIERASAWTRGDIDGMQRLPDSSEDIECRSALITDAGSADLLAQIKRAWLSGLDEHMRGNGTTLAVVNIDLLLDRGGLLDELRARGYSIEAP
ncbi:MAG: TraB/GumN family protein [Steroidobacterales bacterium]